MVGYTDKELKTIPKLYFSPAMDKLTFEPPSCGRGGFLCEQMGMGKTVISLSLHLQVSVRLAVVEPNTLYS